MGLLYDYHVMLTIGFVKVTHDYVTRQISGEVK
jgi:hypothetical protein